MEWSTFEKHIKSLCLVIVNSKPVSGSEFLIADNLITVVNGIVNAFGIFLNPVSEYVDIYNNTIVITGNATGAGACLYLNTSANTFSKIRNNIFINLKGSLVLWFQTFVNLAWISSDYNDLYTTGPKIGFFNALQYADLAAWQVAGIPNTDIHSISVDPLFTNTATFDYTLQATSPCIDKGDPATVITRFLQDFAGNARIKFCTVDMGVFEAQTVAVAGFDNIWLGCVSTDWHNGANWSAQSEPTNVQNILIKGNVPFQPTIGVSNAACKTVKIDVTNLAKITIGAGFRLIVGP